MKQETNLKSQSDPALAALAALKRAGLRAAQEAQRTNTFMVVGRNGAVEHISPQEYLRERNELVNAKLIAPFQLELEFSDQTHGVFDAATYLATRTGPLLEKLRDAHYFARFFIDAGALCWPNGLEISPARLHELVGVNA